MLPAPASSELALHESPCAAGAEEGVQDAREHFNETGVPIEPFNLDKEREEGYFDAEGGYIANNFPQVKDAWLDSIDGQPSSGIRGKTGAYIQPSICWCFSTPCTADKMCQA